MQQRSTVVGIFEKRAQAEGAIRDLRSAGFRDDQIGFIVRTSAADEAVPETIEYGTEATSGAAAGAVSGGILGGVIGAVVSLLIPGFGPAIAGGILTATISGVVIGAAAGGLFGALIGLGVPEEEARYYEGEFQSGRTLVTVRADGRQEEASNILYRNGGYDVNTHAAQTTPVYASTVASDINGDVTVNPDTSDSVMHPKGIAAPASRMNTAPGAFNSDVRSNAMSQTNSNNADAGNPPDATDATNVNNPGASNPEMQTSEIGSDKDVINTGAYYPPVQSDQTPPQNVDYDPTKGPVPEEHAAPVNDSGYGMQRDPSVETDETAKTYDTQRRPGTTMQRESDHTFFGNPDEPGIAPGSYDDPNIRHPRVP